jgi:hypothetical protein
MYGAIIGVVYDLTYAAVLFSQTVVLDVVSIPGA